ncbi:tRNA (cytidine(34)-2'-O)-methyltransferase [bacterium]|nr:tRNA (cytidine(34)-2'-O)-methyltransferase [bacterium]
MDRSLSAPNALTIVLYQPRIPQNTGSIARMCAATGSRLDLINPLFEIDDKKLKRAGLDYWHLLDVRHFESLEDWQKQNSQITPWLVEVGSPKKYTDAQFSQADYLMFGDEQDGIPEALLKQCPDQHLSLPQQGVRSLNLATSVAVVTYEALRQLDWYSLESI